jgi:integrase
MKVVFLYGKNNNKKASTQSINIRVYHTRELEVRRSLKMDISLEGWDFKNSTIVDLSKGTRTFEQSQYLQELKNTLNSIEQSFNKEFLNLKLTHKLESLTKETWKEWCEVTLNKGLGISKEITQEIPYLSNVYEEFIKIKFKDRAANTIKGYRSNLKVLKSFMDYNFFIQENNFSEGELKIWDEWYTKQYGKSKQKEYKFNEIDSSFYRLLREWNTLKGNNDNYFYKIISNLKAILNYFQSIDPDFYKPHNFIKHPDFKALKLVSKHSFLDIDELNLVFNYKGSKYLENVSSLAKILYYGCLRYNELEQEINLIKQGNLKTYQRTVENIEVEYWDVYQKKEDYSKHIPINPLLKKILTEEIPHIISGVNFNKYIKELISEVSIQKEYSISSHTFRRSYITNMVNQGHSESSIMEYSGHKDEKSFRTYCQSNNIKITKLNPIYLG